MIRVRLLRWLLLVAGFLSSFVSVEAATTVRASAINNAASGTALTVARPTGTTTGDLVIVVVHINGNTTIVDNNGATAFNEDLNDRQQTTTGQTVSVFSRRIQDNDPATYAFTGGASGRWAVVAVTFQNPHASVIYDATTTTGDSGGSSDNLPIAPTITTVNANTIHCAIALPDGDTNTILTTPTGYTVEQSGGNEWIAFTDKVIVSPGATGAQQFVGTSTDGWIGVSLAIRDIGAAAANKAGGLVNTPILKGVVGGGLVP